MNKIVIYTAIFGKKDSLHEPTYIPQNCDFVCFTDQLFISRVWDVRYVEPPIKNDPTRSNRYYKILAHKVLPEYETSIYIDGNVLVRGNITELVDNYLADANMAVLDRARGTRLPIGNLREELNQLLDMERRGKHQEDEELMKRQVEHYFKYGFSDDVGFSWNMILVRRHNEPDVQKTMEAWWQELLTWSKRDQLSFNYVAWKHNFRFNYMDIDGYENKYTKRLNHYLPPHRKLYSYFIGATKRIRNVIKR